MAGAPCGNTLRFLEDGVFDKFAWAKDSATLPNPGDRRAFTDQLKQLSSYVSTWKKKGDARYEKGVGLQKILAEKRERCLAERIWGRYSASRRKDAAAKARAEIEENRLEGQAAEA